MNVVKFAELISYLTVVAGHRFDAATISGIEQRVETFNEPEAQSEQLSQPKIDLVPMFDFMLQNQKINAIKEHRRLTGFGLKESKDEIERIMNKFPSMSTNGG